MYGVKNMNKLNLRVKRLWVYLYILLIGYSADKHFTYVNLPLNDYLSFISYPRPKLVLSQLM